jgi:hypothetical protein
LRALVLGVPLPEAVAVAEEPLLGAGLFLVAPRAAHGRVHLQLAQRIQQGDGLQGVAAGVGARFLDRAPLVDGVLHVPHDQLGPGLARQPVAELDGLGKVVARVDVQQRKGEAGRRERLLGQLHHHDGVLAAGKQQHGALELRGHLAHDEDGLGLQLLQVALSVGRDHARVCRDEVRCGHGKTGASTPADEGTGRTA